MHPSVFSVVSVVFKMNNGPRRVPSVSFFLVRKLVYMKLTRLLLFLFLTLSFAVHDSAAASRRLTSGDLPNYILISKPVRLACYLPGAELGLLSKGSLKAGVTFRPVAADRKIKSLEAALKSLKKAARTNKSTALKKQIKTTNRNLKALKTGKERCKFNGSSSSDAASSSPTPPAEPCHNGVQDPGEGGIDCQGTCQAACNPFREHFITSSALASIENVMLDGMSNIAPTQVLTNQEIVPDSASKLLFHFNLDPAKGENNMNVYDWSENGHTGRITGAAFDGSDGVPGHSSFLRFQSPGDKVAASGIGHTFNRTAGLTISTWIRNDGFADNKDSLIWDFGGTKNIRFLQGTGTLRLCVNSGYCRNYTDVVAEGSWHHLMVTIEETVWKVYVNGQLEGQTDGGVGLTDFDADFGLTLGSTMQYGLTHLSMDEISLWNAVLTADQALALYQGKRLTGSFQSRPISTALPVYYLTARWGQTGFPIKLSVTGDNTNWCDVTQNGTAEYFNCGFPSQQFSYRVEFIGDALLDFVELEWRSIPAACEDSDSDGYDNWDGQYPHCTDDGLRRDCDDSNNLVYPNNTNPFCNCDETDGAPRQSRESYFAGQCNDGIDNDCDGVKDYLDPDCAEDPETWENLNLKFTGIDLSIKGSKFHDYMYERLWYDTQSDDDVVLYLKSNTLLRFSHNRDNLKGGGLLASSASLVNRDTSTGLQAPETMRVEVRDPILIAKQNELDIKLTVIEHAGSFDLIVDDLTTSEEDERFDGLTHSNLKDLKSSLITLRYTGSPLMREIDLPRAQEQRIRSGDIIYRFDGDEFRTGSKYDYTTTGGDGGNSGTPTPTSAIFEAMLADPSLLFFRSSGPFSPSVVKGQVGTNGKALYDPDRFNYGIVDEFGDEWHTLTFWDNDWATNWFWDRRDDGSSDGKIVYLVLDPSTPVISFTASAGEEYYTTPPKLYYTPHIVAQTTYLSPGVSIAINNVSNAEPVYYRLNAGDWRQYSEPLTASSLFSVADSVYEMSYKNGLQGPIRTRRIHYQPTQPAQAETHPKLAFPSAAALVAEREAVHGGNAEQTSEYEHHMRYYIEPNTMDFRRGIRSLGYMDTTGYFYQTKSLTEVAYDFAYYGAMEQSDAFFKKAKDALLFFYTVDPIGCEGGKGRMGGPSQERCMYSDGRVTPELPRAYDLLFQYTRENGYAHGMTPIEHIKIRDNLANEAAILLKYPQTWPSDLWTTVHYEDPSVRNFELETTYSGIAMAMPSYDSEYFGTSGADGNTSATHLFAPFPDAPVAWSTLHFTGHVNHPTRPDLFRDSFLLGLYADDGAYVGSTRCGYDQLMYDDVIPFMAMRHNFDGYHYHQLENNLRLEILGRAPNTGERMPDCVTEGSLGRAFMPYRLPYLINSNFADAGLYLWSKQTPTLITSPIDYLSDPSITVSSPETSTYVAPSYAILGSDLTDTQSLMLRSRVLTGTVPHVSGTALQYLAGDFNLIAYGERLVIDLGGYAEGNWDRLLNQNVVRVDSVNDYNSQQVRGIFEQNFLASTFSYARMRTDLSITSNASAFKQKQVNQLRHIFFLNNEFYLLVDSMSSGTGGHDYDFILHGSKGSNSAPSAFVKDTTNDFARWTKPSGVKLLAKFITDVSIDSADLVAHDYVDDNDEPYIAAHVHGTDVDVITLLYPSEAAGVEPVVSRSNQNGLDAAQITTDGGSIYIIIANRNGGSVSYSGVETDARLALIETKLGVVQHYAVISGRQLTLNGDQIVGQLTVGDYFQ